MFEWSSQIWPKLEEDLHERLALEMFGPIETQKQRRPFMSVLTPVAFAGLAPTELREASFALYRRYLDCVGGLWDLVDSGRRDPDLQAFLDCWYDELNKLEGNATRPLNPKPIRELIFGRRTIQ